LPEVALEQDWDHMETITNLIRKSGYRGRIDEKLLLSLRVTRYQSHKTTIDFAEFWRWKRTNQNELN
jgi:AMMECR1 domain-containing protein